ncbi:MAG: DUF116 domain-containing protein [Candidatus Micrarchaeia archaeon]
MPDGLTNIKDIKLKIRALVARAAKIGTIGSISNVAEGITKQVGVLDEAWVQYTTIALNNSLNEGFFKKIPKSQRMVFIPHCLRNTAKCKATYDEEGLHCVAGCRECKIAEIIAACEKNGMRYFVVGGGQQVINLIKKYEPKAVIGIACFPEIKMGLERVTIPAQAVLLRKAGCANTDVDLWEILEKIDMEENPNGEKQ